jgi:hypothetical protein
LTTQLKHHRHLLGCVAAGSLAFGYDANVFHALFRFRITDTEYLARLGAKPFKMRIGNRILSSPLDGATVKSVSLIVAVQLPITHGEVKEVARVFASNCEGLFE